jgi:DNA transformation protein
MAISKQFAEYVIEQLQGLARLTSRRMFSGVGLYSDGLFFGLLYHDRLYFRTDDTTRPEYEARGSEGFRPRPNITRMKMRYYTVPADVLEDTEELVKWARKATAVALALENAKPAKKASGESGQRKARPRKVAPATPPATAPAAAIATAARDGRTRAATTTKKRAKTIR